MLRQGLVLAASLALLSGCFNPLAAPADGTTTSANGTTTTTAASVACNPVIGGTAGADLRACGADEVCVFATASGFSATQTGCFPVVSSQTNDGDPCSTLDACSQGQGCTNQGCQTFCYVGDTCANGASCVADTSANLTVGGRSVGYCAPTTSCALVGDTACAYGCEPYSDGHAQCRASAGNSARGGACVSDNDCMGGLSCDDAEKRCTTYCRVGASDCATGSCLTDARAAVKVGDVAFGYCSL